MPGKHLTFVVLALLSLLLAPACKDIRRLVPTGDAIVTPSPAAQEQADALPLGKMQLQPAFPSLSFDSMTGLYEPPDGTNRLFVLEQAGRIMVFENRSDVNRASVFLDIKDRVNSAGNEEGLLGLAFSPDFASTGHFYLNYTATNPRRTVISRFTAPQSRSGPADPNSESKILEVLQPFSNHNGGQIVFGPDGYLYIGMGDGGSAGDPMGNGQDLNVLLGKLLRIDVSGPGDRHGYRIPPDNPFVGRGTSGVREEIWAYGLRNPWRFSFDPATKDIWLADVGQNSLEEIDGVQKGGNYGWNRMEGSRCFPPTARDCDKTGLILPVFEYPTSGGNCSITGGFLYRGELLPSLKGAYVYADYCSGKVWALQYDGSRVTEHLELIDSDIRISSFGIDRSGNLYVLAHANRGRIFKLAP